MFVISLSIILLFIYSNKYFFENKDFHEKVLIIGILGAAHIVITTEITSLIQKLNNVYVYLLIQLILLFICFLFWFAKANFKIGFFKFRFNFKSFFKNEIFKSKLSFFVLFVLIFEFSLLTFLSIRFPQSNSDSLYNHLSRLGYWLQNGSLKPFESFSPYGQIYPFNANALVYWSILFFRNDKFVGLVQLFSTIGLIFVVYGFSRFFKFSPISSFLAAALVPTLPIIIFESTTAQTDLVAALFFTSAILFLLKGLQKSQYSSLIISGISLALSIGTKQYVLFVGPIYLGLFIYLLSLNRVDWRKNLLTFIFAFTISFCLVGSYIYIQNIIYFGNPMGGNLIAKKDYLRPNTSFSNQLLINSTRITSQFISCEGFPQVIEIKCNGIKAKIIRTVLGQFANQVESTKYLVENPCDEECFSFQKIYVFNEDSSGFGFLFSILIIPSVILSFIGLRKDRRFILLFLIAGFLFMIGVFSILREGWDPYLTRYFIFCTITLLPFTAVLFNKSNILQNLFCFCLILISFLIMIVSISFDASRPIISQRLMNDFYNSETTNLFFKKAVVIIMPFIDPERNIWRLDEIELRTMGAGYMAAPLRLVNMYPLQYANLGILEKKGLVMDYLFFGDEFTRKIFPLIIKNNLNEIYENIKKDEIDAILVSPNYPQIQITGFTMVESANDWKLYVKINK